MVEDWKRRGMMSVIEGDFGSSRTSTFGSVNIERSGLFHAKNPQVRTRKTIGTTDV